MMKAEFDSLVGLTTDQKCYDRIEWVYMNCPYFTNKEQIASFYKLYDMNGIEKMFIFTKAFRDMETELIELKEKYITEHETYTELHEENRQLKRTLESIKSLIEQWKKERELKQKEGEGKWQQH